MIGGRKPVPTALKVLRGNPGQRRLPVREPSLPVAAVPDAPPAELAGDVVALEEWARLEPLLRGARVLTDADRSALVVLCQQWSVYCAAHRHMRQKGALSPYRAVAYQALAAWSRMNDAFGLTPSSRTRVTTAAKTDADQLDTFLA